MNEQEYIAEYVEKHKKILEGLHYGLEYLNKLEQLEEKAERSYKRLKK